MFLNTVFRLPFFDYPFSIDGMQLLSNADFIEHNFIECIFSISIMFNNNTFSNDSSNNTSNNFTIHIAYNPEYYDEELRNIIKKAR